MENLQTKVEASLKKTEKLQDVAHGQELSIKIHEVEHMELLTNNSLVFDKFRTMIKQQEETIGTLIAEKDQLISELNVQKQINIYETTSCEAYGNDIQRIRIPGRDAFPVCCNSTFGSNEGWTVIQRRTDGTLNFDRKWDEYKNGFGDLRGEHWLGLEKVHLMTKFQPHELYIHMENYRNQTFFARYSNFLIGNETQSYEFLSLGEYTGNLENAIETGTNIKFSIRKFYGGWWFSACERWNMVDEVCTTTEICADDD
ncbi:fibrinogen-like protein 1 [Drosophila busckii]|uniref:fibrinogen-like protein 1 n=1 Tax=Drosophila busckii TaxID=30019 RepID=UPI001432E2B2|nr:fibrinogen-like protein 1 [Drosophila busckii]